MKTALVIPVYNEESAICNVLDAIPKEAVDMVIVVDDGSTDATPKHLAARSDSVNVIRHDRKCYIGVSIRDGLKYAVKCGMDAVVVISGNGKDDPRQIPELLKPICDNEADFVQGSRYLDGGFYNKMPWHRRFVTRIYPLIIRMLTGFKATDSTNGYRAFKLSILDDPAIDIDQDWLDECLEYYLSLRILQRGYRAVEIPVVKVYPDYRGYSDYTKVRPGFGWVNRLKPVVYCGILGRQ